MARPDVLLSLVRAPALPPQHAYFGSQSHTPYDRCLRFGPRVAATPARLAPALPARLWTDQTCTGKLISASYRTSGSSAIAGFRPHGSHRAALPQWALQDGPGAGRSSMPGLMDCRFREWEDGQD